MPDSPLQSAATRVIRLIKKRAEWHLIESAGAILDDALSKSRETPARGRPRSVDHERIRALRAAGKSLKEIEAETGASEATIVRACRRTPS